ncbi:MAG TPA: class II aldolase/adducin family protein, partial [Dongiaceae bacterium]|nr:class II aldolase/adducin family protein [Dongiaceae bacterium]
MSAESKARDALTSFGKSMFERGLSFGSAGNLSMRIEGGWLMTPTNVSLGRLDPARISRLDESGKHVGGDAPTKESLLHLAMYGARKSAGAIVHLHSTHSVA